MKHRKISDFNQNQYVKTNLDTVYTESETDLRYNRLIEVGSKLPGDCHDINNPVSEINIPWLDPKLIEEGKEFVKRHWFAVFLAHFVSLMMGSAFKTGLSVMVRTGLTHKKENSLKRYLSTTLHIQSWYESDFNEVKKDVQKVRRLHTKAISTYFAVPFPIDDIRLNDNQRKVLDAVKADISSIPGSQEVYPREINAYEQTIPISQLGMVMTQFSFLGFIVLFPKVFGIHDTKGLDGFCHLWAVLGKYIGIEDEFNLGLHPDKGLMRRLFDRLSVPGLKEADEVAVFVWDAIASGVEQYRPLVTRNSVLMFMIKDLLGADKGSNLLKLMSWVDKFYYYLLHFACKYLLQLSVIRWLTNMDSRRYIALAKQKYL